MAPETQSRVPPHHARRPMNAFLIFCKRHRNVVKDKYPNLENRCITKILGEWWAGLNYNEKSACTILAKQYKDAFFSAHPDFKWYKLPAPSLRTVSSPPENSKHLPLFVENDSGDNDNEVKPDESNGLSEGQNENGDPNYSHNLKLEERHHMNNIFCPGKLADENQLGNLRKLFDNGNGCNNNNRNVDKSGDEYDAFQNNNNCTVKNDLYKNKANELEHALQEANTYILNVFDEKKASDNHPFIYNGPKIKFNELNVKSLEPSHKNKVKKETNIERVYKPKLNVDVYTNSQKKCKFEKCDSFFPKRLSRSCKGKRYEEFKNKGLIYTKSKINATNKNSIQPSNRSNDSAKKFYKVKPLSNPNTNKEKNISDNNGFKCKEQNENLKYCDDDKMCAYLDEDNVSKTNYFDPSDFDLDGKINALPLLNLEEFLMKKKENKNVKKPVRKHVSKQKLERGRNKTDGLKIIPRNNFNDTSRMYKTEMAVGSRKRKAVKQRITHLEFSDSSSYDIRYKNMAFHDRTYLSDLSTLAEVAAKSSKISTTN
uniref:HMG box domain-containing protein n=1 Tax=Xenopsylla cheopis TaxID=163159 RepID=A0A6M2DSB7_XENCH